MKTFNAFNEDIIDAYCEECDLYEDLEITEAELKNRT